MIDLSIHIELARTILTGFIRSVITRASFSRAVINLSGGLDSTTCMAVAKAEGFDPLYALSFNYGQRHERELIAARDVAVYYGAEHHLVEFNLRKWGGSALTDAGISVPTGRGRRPARKGRARS